MSDSATRIPHNMQLYFQEYALESLKLKRDANLIIQRTLERGTWNDLRWLFRAYGKRRIQSFLRQHGERMLSRVTFNYWRKLLRVQRWRRSPFSIAKGKLWEH